MTRVLTVDKLATPGVELLRLSGIEIDDRQGLKARALQQAIPEADAIFVRSEAQITADILRNPGRLRAIVRGGVGVDNIDVLAATRKGIVVMNTPRANTVSTAELTIAHLTALARNLPAADASMRQGKWERAKLTGTQLAGKALGIVGLGRIGQEVARRAAGLDMNVIGFDPFLTSAKACQLGIETAADLDSLLPRCDFLTVHTPLTLETTNLISARELGLMKKGSRVINCARGGIINEEALADALRVGQLAGAALDVFVTEPLPAGHQLLQLPNILLTPHLGASTAEAQAAVAIEAARLLIDFLLRGVVHDAVNSASLIPNQELHTAPASE